MIYGVFSLGKYLNFASQMPGFIVKKINKDITCDRLVHTAYRLATKNISEEYTLFHYLSYPRDNLISYLLVPSLHPLSPKQSWIKLFD